MVDLRLMVLIQPEALASPAQAAAQVLSGGATALQIRTKTLTTRALLDTARGILELCRERECPLIINDRLDVALAVGAHGVHLGPKDLPLSAARPLAEDPSFVMGASARTPERALEAESLGASYLGVGAFRTTSTKPEAEAIGVNGIRAVHEVTRLPLVAIGGIRPQDCAPLKHAGAQGIAVLSGILQGDDLEATTRAYRTAWDSA